MTASLDSIASMLEQTGGYRVLSRLAPRTDCPDPPGEPTFIGLVVDMETTDTDFAADEVIELGILKFEYGGSGHIHRLLDTSEQPHQPGKPIPPEITRPTGITDATVGRQWIDDAAARMLAVDAINRRYARDRVWFATAGLGLEWKLKTDYHSPRHTKLWGELLLI